MTRTFGLKPLNEQRISFDDVFGQALSLGNLYIRAGFQLDDEQFSAKGREAVKRFYDEVRLNPQVSAWLDDTHFRERACRCIAQSAYFALRGSVERKRMLSEIASVLLSTTGASMFPLFTRAFPSRSLVSTTRVQLINAGMNRESLSTPFIRNAICQARNIIKEAVMEKHGGDISALIETIGSASNSLVDTRFIIMDIETSLEHLAKHFMKTFTSKLTRCFTRFSHRLGAGVGKEQPLSASPPSGSLDSLILEIYHGINNAAKKELSQASESLSRGTWMHQRKQWRDRHLEVLLNWIKSNLPCNTVASLVHEKLETTLSSLTTERVLSCLFKPRKQKLPRCVATDALPSSFMEWLERVVGYRVEQAIVATISKHVVTWSQAQLQALKIDPAPWIARPVLRGRSIPLGQDDGQVYRLEIKQNIDASDASLGDVLVTLSFYSGPRVVKTTGLSRARVDAVQEGGFSLEPVTFRLHRRDLGRFHAMLDNGFEPKLPTLSLRPDGKLVLGIPFELVPMKTGDKAEPDEEIAGIEKIVDSTIDSWIARDEASVLDPVIKNGWNNLDEHWTPPAKKPSSNRVARIVKRLRVIVHSGTFTACAGDLGLKTDVTASIVKVLHLDDGTYCLANIHHREEDRHFITQKQLNGKRMGWLLPDLDPGRDTVVPNLKRKLHHLIKDTRQLQSDIDRFKNSHPSDYKFHVHYREMHDQLVTKWQKVRNIHDELARQIATRLVAVCEYHDVDVLRLENLSWSQHSRKQDVGYYLKSNQVHWFFSQVQSYARCLVHRAGIDVELVNARYTSQTCSRCHERGHRKGKTFTCPHCGLRLDADLNAARNIAVAPTSPFGTFKVPRGLVPRATRHWGPAIPRPLPVEPEPVVLAT